MSASKQFVDQNAAVDRPSCREKQERLLDSVWLMASREGPRTHCWQTTHSADSIYLQLMQSLVQFPIIPRFSFILFNVRNTTNRTVRHSCRLHRAIAATIASQAHSQIDVHGGDSPKSPHSNFAGNLSPSYTQPMLSLIHIWRCRRRG